MLPYATVGIAKWRRDYDNNAPRDWLLTLDGRRKRAYHAHLNHFEALPAFAATVIIAHLSWRGWVHGLRALHFAVDSHRPRMRYQRVGVF